MMARWKPAREWRRKRGMAAHAFARSRSCTPLSRLCAGALLLLGSCGPDQAPEEPSPGTPQEPAASAPAQGGARSARGAEVSPAPLTGDEPYESAELGALHGAILFTGKAPERFALGAGELPECKHHSEVDQRSNVVIVEDGKLAGVFVYLKSGYDRARIPPAPATPVTLDQRGCMYLPRVLGLQLGQKLLVANGDPATHNVNLSAKRNKGSNRSMGAGQPPLEFQFDKREERIVVKCDIHPWMGAAVFVEEHPWFAVSDAHGAFRIRDVPPGEYVVEGVHEILGDVAGRVTVTAGRSTGFTLTLAD